MLHSPFKALRWSSQTWHSASSTLISLSTWKPVISQRSFQSSDPQLPNLYLWRSSASHWNYPAGHQSTCLTHLAHRLALSRARLASNRYLRLTIAWKGPWNRSWCVLQGNLLVSCLKVSGLLNWIFTRIHSHLNPRQSRKSTTMNE